MENIKKNNFKDLLKTLLIISSIIAVTFYGISFISGAADLTNRFLIYFGILMVSVVLLAIIFKKIADYLRK